MELPLASRSRSRLNPLVRQAMTGLAQRFGSTRCTRLEGVMLLHTIAPRTFKELSWQGLTLTHELVHFSKFILAEIFPGGWLPTVPTVEEHAAKAGFTVTRIQSLQPHDARTLETWAAAVRANQEEAIAMSKPI